jgi:hypothetical protein
MEEKSNQNGKNFKIEQNCIKLEIGENDEKLIENSKQNNSELQLQNAMAKERKKK